MNLRRLPWSVSSMRLRLLAGLAVLLVTGLVASSVAGAFLLSDFLDHRYDTTLQDSAARIRLVLGHGPQTVNGDQIGTLLGPPLGIVGVGPGGQALFSTGTADTEPAGLIAATTPITPGRIVHLDDSPSAHSLSAIRIPSPGISVTRAGEPVTRPAALIICIDTEIGDDALHTLIRRQLTLVAVALVLLLGLAVLVLRLGMRPLARMADTAGAIAAGSLQERLPLRGDRSETDQLALAVNNAFDAQARAEATIRSFAADASHELRTPLATISGWLDLYHQGGLHGSGLEMALEHIDAEVGRMRLLVEELALLARLDAGRPLEHEEIDLTALAEGVVSDAQVIYPSRDITLVCPGSALIHGDSSRLQQVLRNLVGNAVQHTPEPTAVRVEITTTAAHVRARVIDNGPGIPAADLPRVFERFYRAETSRSRAYGGSGLGLAIVEAITHAHHGQVNVDSTLGTGTTVTLTLPR